MMPMPLPWLGSLVCGGQGREGTGFGGRWCDGVCIVDLRCWQVVWVVLLLCHTFGPGCFVCITLVLQKALRHMDPPLTPRHRVTLGHVLHIHMFPAACLLLYSSCW
jgi:hypothetical protein